MGVMDGCACLVTLLSHLLHSPPADSDGSELDSVKLPSSQFAFSSGLRRIIFDIGVRVVVVCTGSMFSSQMARRGPLARERRGAAWIQDHLMYDPWIASLRPLNDKVTLHMKLIPSQLIVAGATGALVILASCGP